MCCLSPHGHKLGSISLRLHVHTSSKEETECLPFTFNEEENFSHFSDALARIQLCNKPLQQVCLGKHVSCSDSRVLERILLSKMSMRAWLLGVATEIYFVLLKMFFNENTHTFFTKAYIHK